MAIRVSISDQQESLEVDRAWLRSIVRRTLRGEQVADAEISLALIDDSTMQVLNRQHLNHDYPTDVLSFLLSDAALDNPHPGGAMLEGELIVSTDTAIRQSQDYDWSPHDELALYVVHGALHLCGYDDHDDHDREVMQAREREVLAHWGLVPHYRN